MESDETLLQEERSAVGAILGEDCEVGEDWLKAWIPRLDASPPPYELLLRFGTEYPSLQPPQLEIRAAHLSDDVKKRTEDELYELFLPGEVEYSLLHANMHRFLCTFVYSCVSQTAASCSTAVQATVTQPSSRLVSVFATANGCHRCLKVHYVI